MTKHEGNQREEKQGEQALEAEPLLKILTIGDRKIATGQTYWLEEVVAALRSKRLEH